MKIKLLIFIDWYLPAYKAGGPIQSIANLVSRLKEEFEISIITSNSDLGEPLKLEPSELNIWIKKEGYQVMYVDSAHQNRKFYLKELNEKQFDVVYFNSLFSIKFTLLPFWILRNKPIKKVLATRGMLGKGALAIKPTKKMVFLKLFKLLNLHKKVVWHATAQSEVVEIKNHFGENRSIVLAPNLSAINNRELLSKNKKENQINLFFLSRISVKKNLLGALKILSQVNVIYEIRFNIIGPIDDNGYWGKCLSIIETMPKHVKINYLGAIPNNQLAMHLIEEHVLMLPTFHENFGHVIMESWQHGCPVMISDQTPWRNLKRDKLGVDISIENEQEWVKELETLCAMSNNDFMEWSKLSYKYAKAFIEDPNVLEQNKALFLNTNYK